MSVVDLRDPTDQEKLKPLAHFSVLSYMLYPDDLPGRERLTAKIGRETGEISARRAPLPHAEAERQLELLLKKGGLSGFLTLTQIQLHQQDWPQSLSNAIKIALDVMPEWTNYDRAGIPRPAGDVYYTRNRKKVFENWRKFLKAQFLWAAFMHKEEYNESKPAWLNSVEQLPEFLGYAELFAEHYRKIPVRDQGLAPNDIFKDRWKFTIPKHLETHPSIRALPLPDTWKRIITR
jgi:hypothetical protein